MSENLKTLTRTVIRAVILSEGPYDPDNLGQVHYDIVEGECSGRWGIESSETLTPAAMEKALREQESDADFLLGDAYASGEPRIRVEFDAPPRDGDDAGRYAYVPVALVDEEGSVEKAFAIHTGIPARHIVRYWQDKHYDENGKRLKIETECVSAS